MDNLVVLETGSRWILTHCPGTGDEVVGSGWDKHLFMPEGETIWWQCPSCGGWHVMMFDNVVKSQSCPN